MAPLDIHRYVNGIRTVLRTVNVSLQDYHTKRLCEYTWYEHPKTHQVFATYAGKRVYLQDIIKGAKGPWIHINGNPSDFTNRNLVKNDENLRTVKRTQGTAKVVGVCFVKRRNRWKATISGKLIGYYKTEEEATWARIKGVRALNPMIQFVPEGTDPDGPSGVLVAQGTEGGRPDAYVDLDDIESMPNLEPVSDGMPIIRDRDYWKAIPPPRSETNVSS